MNTANNNFPLRGSKLNAFKGGIRVPQFLFGGWILKNRLEGENFKSSMYVFIHDWTPLSAQHGELNSCAAPMFFSKILVHGLYCTW